MPKSKTIIEIIHKDNNISTVMKPSETIDLVLLFTSCFEKICQPRNWDKITPHFDTIEDCISSILSTVGYQIELKPLTETLSILLKKNFNKKFLFNIAKHFGIKSPAENIKKIAEELAKYFVQYYDQHFSQNYNGYKFACDELIAMCIAQTEAYLKASNFSTIFITSSSSGHYYAETIALYCTSKRIPFICDAYTIRPEKYTDSFSLFGKTEPVKNFQKLLEEKKDLLNNLIKNIEIIEKKEVAPATSSAKLTTNSLLDMGNTPIKEEVKISASLPKETVFPPPANYSPELASLIAQAEKGDSSAQCNLGLKYSTGTHELPLDEKKAAEWFLRSANENNPYGQYYLAEAYVTGRGVEKDESEAINLYCKAAQQGILLAKQKISNYSNQDTVFSLKITAYDNVADQCKLAAMYENGCGVSKDEAQAIQWYLKAAEKGNANAQFHLGRIFYERKEYEIALEWLTKAVQQGNMRAENLQQIADMLSLIDKAKAALESAKNSLKFLAPKTSSTEPTAEKISQPPNPNTAQAVIPPPLSSSQISAEKPTEKSWHFDSTFKPSQLDKNKEYELLMATPNDIKKVIDSYQLYPVPGYEIKSIKIIYNPVLNRSFALRMHTLQQRKNNPAFKPRWQNENNPEWRKETNKIFEDMTRPYTDTDYPDVKLAFTWHGTKPEILDSIFKSGFANLAITDSGFFGKGIYSTDAAEYANRVYSKGSLLVNWVAVFSPYPTIHGDMEKLQGKGNNENYDAHFIPVVPKNFNKKDESIYLPCKPNEKYIYNELVTFESTACLPRYIVELQNNLLKEPTTLFVDAKEEYEQGYSFYLQEKYFEAIPHLKQAAEQNFPPAQAILGLCYEKGRGVIINLKMAKQYYEAAANQGYSTAKSFLTQLSVSHPELFHYSQNKNLLNFNNQSTVQTEMPEQNPVANNPENEPCKVM